MSLQPSGGLGLRAKTGQVGLGSKCAAQDHLDRHGPFRVSLPGFINHAHAAPAQFFKKFIIAKRAWQR